MDKKEVETKRKKETKIVEGVKLERYEGDHFWVATKKENK